MRGGFGLRVAVFEDPGGAAEFAFDCGFNALLLKRLAGEELDAARALRMGVHFLTSRPEAEETDSCWSGPISELPESSTALMLTEPPPRPLPGLDYVVDARALEPGEMVQTASLVGCPYAPLLKRRGRRPFFPRAGWLDSRIAALAESGIEAAAVELGPVEDPAECVCGYFAGLKLASPRLPYNELFSGACERAFRPRTKAARRVLEELFERAESALGGRDGIDGLDPDGLTRYIGGMKPLAVVPGKVARECAEGERVRAIARYAADALKLARSALEGDRPSDGDEENPGPRGGFVAVE